MAAARMHFLEVIILRGTTVIPMIVLGFAEAALHAYILIVYVHSALLHANVAGSSTASASSWRRRVSTTGTTGWRKKPSTSTSPSTSPCLIASSVRITFPHTNGRKPTALKATPCRGRMWHSSFIRSAGGTTPERFGS